MRTWIFAFAYFFLILQVVLGTYSAFPDRSQVHQWNDLNKVFRVDAKNYMQEIKPLFQDDVEKLDYNNNLDDVYESQLPPPPTQEDKRVDFRFQDKTVDNANRDTSTYSTPNDSYVLSGAGHLETNVILKDPNTLLKKNSVPPSKSNNDDDKVGITIRPIIYKQNKHPDLDKAVEDAVNSLPSAEESPLVPLIKIFNERIQKQSGDGYGNEEDMERKNFLNKHIILKLANNVQRESEEKAPETKDFKLYQSEIQIQQNEKESPPFQSINETNDENSPCDCKDGCDGDTRQGQSESEQVSSLDQQNPTEHEVEFTNDSRNPKLLAHVIVMLRRPKTEDSSTKKIRFSNVSEEEFVPFRSREVPPLAHMFIRGSRVKYTSTNNNPSFPFEESEERASKKEPPVHENTVPLALRMIGERLATGMASKGCDEMNESSQEESKASFSRYSSTENDQISKLPDIKRIQYDQPIPKEFLLLKHLIGIMKEKAAANALQENQETQLPQFPSSSSFYEPSKVTSPTNEVPQITRFAILRPRNQRPQSQLPPLHFPDENSSFEIRHLDDSTVFPNFGQEEQNESDSDSELSPSAQILSRIQEMHQIQDSSQQPPYNSPQDLPLFMKNILTSLSRPAGASNLQPIPTEFIPDQKPTEEKNPVLFRSAFSPFLL